MNGILTFNEPVVLQLEEIEYNTAKQNNIWHSNYKYIDKETETETDTETEAKNIKILNYEPIGKTLDIF